MDTCQEFAALLDLYVDGELPPAEAERVQAHLETCGVCRSYVDDIQAIRAAFPTIEDTPVPEGFADGVMAAIRVGKAPRKRRSAPRWARVALPLAACLAIFAVVQVPLLQRDTAADQAVGQEQIQDIADTSSEKAQSRQETEEADEPEATQAPGKLHHPRMMSSPRRSPLRRLPATIPCRKTRPTAAIPRKTPSHLWRALRRLLRPPPRLPRNRLTNLRLPVQRTH